MSNKLTLEIPELEESQIKSFNERIDKSNECWNWIGHVENGGYGIFKTKKKQYKSHRVSYKIHHGNMPIDMAIDHICRNRTCVRPDHLRLVTFVQNVKENTISPCWKNSVKTHCKWGHKFTPENTNSNGNRRRCRVCKRRDEKGRKRVKKK